MNKFKILLFLFIVLQIPLSLWGLNNLNRKTQSMISPAPSISAKDPHSLPIEAPRHRKENNRILFVSDKTGDYEIYQMDLQSKETINITNNPANDMNPQVSPDGKTIAFYSDRDGDNEIYLMNLASNGITQITYNDKEFHDYDPSFSPDGKRIVFKSTRDDSMGDIFLMNADGSDQINLTPTRKETEEWDPLFTKDGDKIIFIVRNNQDDLTDEMYIMDADGHNVVKLTDNKVPDWYPSLNPQDGSIAFISRKSPTVSDDVFWRIHEGAEFVQVTTLPGNDADPAWDPKGERIIFINDSDKDYDMYLMDADGSDLRNIENTPYNELSPVFLP